jgi:hypothetical protein
MYGVYWDCIERPTSEEDNKIFEKYKSSQTFHKNRVKMDFSFTKNRVKRAYSFSRKKSGVTHNLVKNGIRT